MEKINSAKRKELAGVLLLELKESYALLGELSEDIENHLASFYQEALNNMQEELENVIEEYHKNVFRVRDINSEITVSINSWYEFVKDEKEISKFSFPFRYYSKKRSLNKIIKGLNIEISSITINNRFAREKLTMLEHQLEIKTVSLAKSGASYTKFENILSRQKALLCELKYLIPTIPGLCPADLTPNGIDNLLDLIAN